MAIIVRLLKPHGPHCRSILDLDKSMLDEYLDMCQKGLLRREMRRTGRTEEYGGVER